MKMWKRVLAAALCVLLGVSCLPSLSTFAVGYVPDYVQAKIDGITAAAGAPGVDADTAHDDMAGVDADAAPDGMPDVDADAEQDVDENPDGASAAADAEPETGSDRASADAPPSEEPEAEPEPKDWTGYTPISTAQQLSDIRNGLAGKYYLTCDIVFTEADFAEGGAFYNSGQGWSPIGTKSDPFTGTFDGDGHTIQNLVVHATGTNSDVYAGLFGYVKNGAIQNLGMIDSEITASSTSSSSSYAGGIAGYVYVSGTISECYNTGSVSASSTSSTASAGGIAGYFNGTSISKCYNTGSVSTSSTSSSSSYAYAGGIAGYVSGSGTISECYNTGSVPASSTSFSSSSRDCAYAGGIAGYVSGSGTISECYNTGSVSASASDNYFSHANAGGIAGCVNGGTIRECYYLDNCSKGVDSGTDTAVKCTLEQMKNQATFEGFDFDSIWTMGDDCYCA